MKNEQVSKIYANKYVVMLIIFWLGILTGALALIMFRGSMGNEAQSSLFRTTPAMTNLQYYIPTPPGGFSLIPIAPVIPTPPGGIPTPPGGIPTPPGGFSLIPVAPVIPTPPGGIPTPPGGLMP